MDTIATHSPDSNAVELDVYAVIKQLESRAGAAEWDDVEALITRLRQAVMEIPAANRRRALLAAQRCVDKVLAGARSARHALSGRLGDLSRGKAAKKAYELR